MTKAKKSLGQNFLIDKYTLEKITNTAVIKNKNILEIGPGKGALTLPLSKFVKSKSSSASARLKENNLRRAQKVLNDIHHVKSTVKSAL